LLGRIPRDAETLDAGFALGGERVLTLSPRQLSVWDSATGQRLGEVPLSAGKLPQLSLNGRYAVITTQRADQTPAFVVWDLQTMQRSGQMITAENAGPVTVDSTGRYLAIGGRDPVVRVWSLPDGSLAREFDHGSPLRMVAFDPSGKWLATDDLSSTFRLWNTEEGGPPVIERFGISAWYADFADDSSSLLFGSSDRVFRIARLPDGLGAGVSLRHARVNRSIAGPIMLATRNLALTSDASRTVKLWSVPAPQVSTAPRSRRFPGGTRAALSADGQRIAIGTTFGDVRIHAVGAPGSILLGGNESADAGGNTEVICLAFSDDRRLLASATIDGRVKLWDADSGAPLDIQIVHPDGGAHDLVFVDEGRRLVSASRREVIVTDLNTGEFTARLRIQANHPQIAVAEKSGEIFIADDLNGVTLWNWEVGIAERIVGGEYRIRTVAVNPDGTRMVTANDDRELVVWDVEEGIPMEQTVQVAGKVDDMWLTRGDRLIVQAGYWLQLVGVYPTGLLMRNTRMLADAPASVRPAAEAGSAFVLSPSPSRPLVTRMMISEPAQVMLEGDPAELRNYWRDRLALTLDEEGVAQPIQNQALMISAAQSETVRN
jgi:WD40 repeat protein